MKNILALAFLFLFIPNFASGQKWLEELKEKDREILNSNPIHIPINSFGDEFRKTLLKVLEVKWNNVDYIIDTIGTKDLNIPFLSIVNEETFHYSNGITTNRILFGVHYYPNKTEINTIANIQLDQFNYLPQKALITLALMNIKDQMDALIKKDPTTKNIKSSVLYVSESDLSIDKNKLTETYSGELKIVTDGELFELLMNPKENILLGIADRPGKTFKQYMAYRKENPNAGVGHVRYVFDPFSGSFVYKDYRAWNSMTIPGFTKKDFKVLNK